jgi:choloylglycine hydrolase
MCTDFLLPVQVQSSNILVNGRSMEYGKNLGSQILVGGVGTTKTSTAPKSSGSGTEPGLTWTAKYGYVGLNAAGMKDAYGNFLTNMITDGMNNVGLAIGGLWLDGSTQYQPVTNASQALYIADFASFVLGTCQTVTDVETAIGGVQVWCDADPISQMPYIPLHFSIHDANSGSIVIEFLGGPPSIQPNPVGVLTNEPPFAWHLSNIENYVNLSATDAPGITIGNTSFAQTGHGSGMLGLPGDSTPPSRFIRALLLKQFALQLLTSSSSDADVCGLALHLLNGVDIPLGTSVPQNSADGDDYTQWAVIKLLSSAGGTFSYRTYDNPTVCQIDLSNANLFSTPSEATYQLPTEPSFIDITTQLIPQ